MAYLLQRYALIGIGVTLILMILGSDGDLTMVPSNRAVLSGTSKVNMSCASNLGYGFIGWSYLPVGGSSDVIISAGMIVPSALKQDYEVHQSGDEQINLVILNATAPRAGTYYCRENSKASAQLIIFNSDPVCSMTPNAPTELLYNQTVQMSCSVSYVASTSQVTVDMIWSKESPAIVVNSSKPQYTTSGNLTTAVSTITQTPGNVAFFPIFSCNTSFKVNGYPPESANNAPDYSKSTQLFSSPIKVILPKPEGSKDNSTEAPPGRGGPSGDNNIIIVGVVGGVGGALLIAAVAGLIYWCLKKKKNNKAGKYTPGVSEGTVNEPEHPPPPSPSGTNVQVEDQMNNDSRHNSTYGTTGQHDQPYIDEDGLQHYAQIQLENNPHSRQSLQEAAETIYSDVSFV